MSSVTSKIITIQDGVPYVIQSVDPYDTYYITGTVALTGNWTIGFFGTPAKYQKITFIYKGTVTLAGSHIAILGETINDDYASKEYNATAVWNGASWEVRVDPDFDQTNLIKLTHIKDENVSLEKLTGIIEGRIITGTATLQAAMCDIHLGGRMVQGNGTTIEAINMSVLNTMLMGDATKANAVAITGPDVVITHGGAGVGLANIVPNMIVNADINAAAAIVYTKLNLANSIVNADIAAGALIAYNKLANLTSACLIVGSVANVPTERAITGVVAISNTGVTSFVNSQIHEVALGSETAGLITKGAMAGQYIEASTFKPLLDGVTNNLFAVKAGDVIIEIGIWVGVASGVAQTINVGLDANANPLGGGDADALIELANSNAQGSYSCLNATYDGVNMRNADGVKIDLDGNVTVTSSVDITGSAIVGWAYMKYIPA